MLNANVARVFAPVKPLNLNKSMSLSAITAKFEAENGRLAAIYCGTYAAFKNESKNFSPDTKMIDFVKTTHARLSQETAGALVA